MKNTKNKIKGNKMKLTNIITTSTKIAILTPVAILMFTLMVGTLSAQYYTYDYNSPDNNSNSLYNNSSYNNSQYNSSYSYKPYVAENGDVKGYDNDGDGRLEPTYVKSYYKSDGTYVRSHYRAKPRRY